MKILNKIVLCFDFRNPNSSDLSIQWNTTSADKPSYLSLDGDNTCIVNERLNSSRIEFWDNIYKIVQLKQKL